MSNIWTIFWAVLAANVVGYFIVDAIQELINKYKIKKRLKEMEAFLDYMEDEEADDDWDDEDDDCCEDDNKK